MTTSDVESRTTTTKVAKRSSHPLLIKLEFNNVTAFATSASIASVYRTSAERAAITSAAETPFPETSASTTARRFSLSGIYEK